MGSTQNNSLIKKLINGIENIIIRKWNNNKIAIVDYIRKQKIHGVCKIIGPIYLHNILINENVTVFPSKYFYPIGWHNISGIDVHKNIKIPNESFTFQYGYTTNNLKELI